jgi:hypothetical protein
MSFLSESKEISSTNLYSHSSFSLFSHHLNALTNNATSVGSQITSLPFIAELLQSNQIFKSLEIPCSCFISS